jgi:Putative auto-transporter adhesin, head GIN domain/Outer membrane protein beta-barrel domain
MKKIIYILAIGLSSLSSFAQTSENRNLSGFTKIDASGGAEVVLTLGEASVKVKAEEEDLKNIITDVSSSTLNISTKGSIKNNFTIYVSMSSLDAINASGAAYVKSDTTFNSDKMELTASGASKIKLDIVCKELQSNATGASSLVLTGATENHTALVSGAASLKAQKLSSLSTTITASGASSAKINVNQKLNANASGASSIKYSGNPTDKVLNAAGTSDIKHFDPEMNNSLGDSDTSKHTHRGINRNGDDWNWDWNWDNSFNHWQGIELNLNGLMGANGNTSLPKTSEHMSINYGARSLSWNLNLAEKNFHIYKDYINLVTGIGFGFNSYQFKNPIRLNADSSYTNYAWDSTIVFDKNKLKTSYVQMPLMLEFNTSKSANKSFHIGIGVIGGYKLNAKTIRTYEVRGTEYKEKRKDDYNINPFKLDATARIGYGAFTMFATYSLTPLFESKKGPQLNPFTVGIRIIPFSEY